MSYVRKLHYLSFLESHLCCITTGISFFWEQVCWKLRLLDQGMCAFVQSCSVNLRVLRVVFCNPLLKDKPTYFDLICFNLFCPHIPMPVCSSLHLDSPSPSFHDLSPLSTSWSLMSFLLIFFVLCSDFGPLVHIPVF